MQEDCHLRDYIICTFRRLVPPFFPIHLRPASKTESSLYNKHQKGAEMDKKLFLPFMVLVVLLVSLACSAVTGSPEPSATLPPLATTVPLPTSTPRVTSLVSDDFSSASSGWGVGTDAEGSIEYVDGAFLFEVYSDYYIIWSGPNRRIYTDVRANVDVVNSSTDDVAMFGIICHEQDSQDFYFLGVTGGGQYAIAKSIVGQDNVYLADGTSASIPAAGQSFTIGADCGNGNLALYVNDQQIATAQDSTFTSGYVGLFAWSDANPNATKVSFDNFELRQLP